MSECSEIYVSGIEDCITDSNRVLENIDKSMQGILKALLKSNELKEEHLNLLKAKRGS